LNEKIIKEGKFPPRFLNNLKLISKIKKNVAKNKTAKDKKDGMTTKQSRNVDNARRMAAEITTALMEYNQRCESATLKKSRFLIKGKDMNAEVFFLTDSFIVKDGKIQKLSGDKLVNSTPKELQDQLLAYENKEITIDLKSIDTLKKVFGEFDLVY